MYSFLPITGGLGLSTSTYYVLYVFARGIHTPLQKKGGGDPKEQPAMWVLGLGEDRLKFCYVKPLLTFPVVPL